MTPGWSRSTCKTAGGNFFPPAFVIVAARAAPDHLQSMLTGSSPPVL